MYTAYTTEADDLDDARNELLGQLDLGALGKNSIGIMLTHFDFIDTGVAQAIGEELPFDVIGMTTMANLSGGDYNMYRLGLAVLTSDDVDFSAASTAPLTVENSDREIRAAYTKARAKSVQDPKFIISFLPYLDDVTGADILKTFDQIVDGIPIWGSTASGMDMSYKHCRILMNGVAEPCALTMVVVSGAVDPTFVVTNLPESNVLDIGGTVTDSNGCWLKTVDGMPFAQYMKSIGLDVGNEDVTTIPLMVNYKDGSSADMMAFYRFFEDGSTLTGGRIPVGASISIGEIDHETIMATVGKGLDRVLATGRKDGLLMLPCITRYIMLAPDQNAEMAYAAGKIPGTLPYSLGYSGGEVCPVMAGDGKYHNRYHNFSFSACIF
jgi:hypothetical protein